MAKESYSQIIFELFLGNGEIVYYQDVPQLPVPLNTLHTINLNVKSQELLQEHCLIKNTHVLTLTYKARTRA